MLKRIFALVLTFVLSLSFLASCNETAVQDGGDRKDGSWEGVDFKGQTVSLCISTNQCSECSFPAASIYTKGPDKAESNEVAKEVLARNTKAESELGVRIEYSEVDLPFSGVQENIRTIVQTSSKTSPDIYNNDMYGVSRAMVDGLLWNVKNPGEDVKSYFDFSAKGWYTDFMRGCTFDQNKYYAFAGDYFIDMIRMAWVLYVNHDILLASMQKMPTWCTDIDTFYAFVEDGLWDLDMLGDMVSRVHVDGGLLGYTECEDPVLGLAYNHGSDWIVSSSSYVTLYYQDKENGYRNVTGEHEIFKTDEEAENYLNEFYVPKIVAVNERMIKNGRKPLFKDPTDLKACYLWIDKLLEFQEVEKINEFLGCKSFKDFDPNSYEL